jgi:hypothetical protein
MNSMAQQASPIGIGQSEFLRIQLKAASTRVKTTSDSSRVSYPISALVRIFDGVPNPQNEPKLRWKVEASEFVKNFTKSVLPSFLLNKSPANAIQLEVAD